MAGLVRAQGFSQVVAVVVAVVVVVVAMVAIPMVVLWVRMETWQAGSSRGEGGAKEAGTSVASWTAHDPSSSLSKHASRQSLVPWIRSQFTSCITSRLLQRQMLAFLINAAIQLGPFWPFSHQ
mmetsp:Transcript_8797/g.22152  ORF Transcript_8797/g.22152 Transcript_8797/m.22152 type:complete len:123 (+) Transcript_8797:541-909(+)